MAAKKYPSVNGENLICSLWVRVTLKGMTFELFINWDRGFSVTGTQGMGDGSECTRGGWASKSCQTSRLLRWGWRKRNPTPSDIWIHAQRKRRRSLICTRRETSFVGHEVENSSGCCSRLGTSTWRNGFSGGLKVSSFLPLLQCILLLYHHDHTEISNDARIDHLPGLQIFKHSSRRAMECKTIRFWYG